MSLAAILTALGAALISATLAAFNLSAATALVVRFQYIAHEERAMHRAFDARYETYCRTAGRWLGRRRAT